MSGNQTDFWHDESGATVVEYVLLLAVLALGVLVAIAWLRDVLFLKMDKEARSIDKAH